MATKTVSRVFVDTNIIIRATIASAPLHSAAMQALARLRERGAELWISNQVIREYIANLTRPQHYGAALPIDVVLDQVSRLYNVFRIAEDTTAVLGNLLKLLADVPVGGKQVHDANIVATMLAYDIGELLTHNVEDMKRFSAKIAITPLEA